MITFKETIIVMILLNIVLLLINLTPISCQSQVIETPIYHVTREDIKRWIIYKDLIKAL